MSIIKRYFVRQLTGIFIMLMLVLTGLAWMMQIMSMMKFLLNYGVELDNFVGLTALMIPFIMSIIIPFVAFIAAIFIYNKMIAENEVTVMAASTMSPGQIAAPAMWLAGLLTAAHLALNIWVVPASQALFYDTQWNLRYGLAHMKLQESAFTKLADGLVVYVERVSGHDLSQLMLSDTRDADYQRTIFAERGKLVATPRGLSIVMSNGSLVMTGGVNASGTFDTFDMDLNMVEKSGASSFRVRRIGTMELIRDVRRSDTAKQHKMILSELATRLLGPWMNLVLVGLCLAILLRAPLLRRRMSMAPAIAVASMGCAMAMFMSASSMVATISQWMILAGVLFGALGIIIWVLVKK